MNILLNIFEEYLKEGIKKGTYTDEDGIYDAVEDFAEAEHIYIDYEKQQLIDLLYAEIDMEKFVLFF